MRKRTKSVAFRFILAVLIWLFAAAAAVFVQAKPRAASPDNKPSAPQAAASQASDYVGADTCKACHGEVYDRWAQTPHYRTTLDTRNGPEKHGCEACHGPGAAHVAGGGDVSKIFKFDKATAQEVNTRCLSCHATSTRMRSTRCTPGAA